MYRLWGVLLGLVLTAALPVLDAIVGPNGLHLAEAKDSMLVAVAFLLFCLLGVAIFKPSGGSRQMRVMRGRTREDEQ